MEILRGIEIIDLVLYIKKLKILVVCDFHVGFEESLQNKGFLLPKFQLDDTLKRLNKILKKIPKPDKIIINGDLKHEFGSISNQEWSDSLKLLDFLSKKCNKLIIIRGNHDKILEPLLKKRGICLKNEYREKGVLILHGDKIPKSFEKNIIIGHEHPSIKLEYDGRKEIYKCFLKGKFTSNNPASNLIVMPSFNLVTEGSNVLSRRMLSPFLKQSKEIIDAFEVFIVGDKIYRFGNLASFR